MATWYGWNLSCWLTQRAVMVQRWRYSTKKSAARKRRCSYPRRCISGNSQWKPLRRNLFKRKTEGATNA